MANSAAQNAYTAPASPDSTLHPWPSPPNRLRTWNYTKQTRYSFRASVTPRHGPSGAVTGTDEEEALRASAVLLLRSAGALKMELIDVARLPGWYFS